MIAELLLLLMQNCVQSLCGTPAEPDIPVDIYGFVMTLINTVDASYFVVYASYTGHFGSLLSVRLFHQRFDMPFIKIDSGN